MKKEIVELNIPTFFNEDGKWFFPTKCLVIVNDQKYQFYHNPTAIFSGWSVFFHFPKTLALISCPRWWLPLQFSIFLRLHPSSSPAKSVGLPFSQLLNFRDPLQLRLQLLWITPTSLSLISQQPHPRLAYSNSLSLTYTEFHSLV